MTVRRNSYAVRWLLWLLYSVSRWILAILMIVGMYLCLCVLWHCIARTCVVARLICWILEKINISNVNVSIRGKVDESLTP